MKTFEIALLCSCCCAEQTLGYVQADTAYDAKQQAERLWPDARYEEMIARVQPCVDQKGRLIPCK
jgi:hypothetical protein